MRNGGFLGLESWIDSSDIKFMHLQVGSEGVRSRNLAEEVAQEVLAGVAAFCYELCAFVQRRCFICGDDSIFFGQTQIASFCHSIV